MAKKKRKPIRRKPQPVEIQSDRNEVHLKSFLGMSPGLYLTVLYSIAILFILFMLLFYKGVRDKGEYLTVTTFPPGAAVEVDGLYVGSSPCEALVTQGIHTVTVSKPHFTQVSFEDEFRSPVFATLFVRPRRVVNIDLELSEPAALAREGLADFAANPHIPEILIETVLGANNTPSVSKELFTFIDNSKYFVTNSLQLHSYIYALSSLEANLNVTTPTSLISTVNKIVRLNQKYENFPLWLAVVLQEETGQRVVDTPWFSRVVSVYRTRYDQLQAQAKESNLLQSGTGSAAVLRDLRFLNIPGGQLLQGDGQDGFATVQIPHPISIPPFYLSETEVPNKVFRAFLEDSPDWNPRNRSALIRQGLVDEDYLAAWRAEPDQPDWEALPVTHVSFFAVQAFCKWFTTNLPPAFSEYTARLPFESEWEWAARGGLVGADYPTGRPSEEDRFFSSGIQGPSPVGGSLRNGYGLRDMTGNVWEWCLDWYSPVKYLFTSMKAENNDFDSSKEIPIGAEKVIRGGSWANQQELIKVSTRGSQPPEWSTPYLGFRIALSRYIP